MTPLQAISEWFESQSAEIQEEISFLLEINLFDNENPNFSSCVEDLRKWLRCTNIDSYNHIGRAARFRACFELAFAHRFNESGWDRPKHLFKSVLTEGASNVGSRQFHMSPTAFKMLRSLPERVEEWKRIGVSWNEIRGRYLTDEALNRWAEITVANEISR